MHLSSQRRLGLILGLVFGVGFSVTSNYINSLVMPDIPLEAPWPGTIWLTVLSVAMFGVLGLLAAWTEENLPGILLSALVGTLVSSIWILISDSSNRVGTMIVILFFVFLPRIFFHLPFSWLMRWLVDKIQYRAYGRDVAPVKRLLPVFISFLVVVLLGATARVSEEEHTSLTRMKDLIEEGMSVSTRAELPNALQDIHGFVENAEGEYSFSLGANPDALPVQRPFVDYGEEEPFVIVNFKNGFRFGCVFTPPYVVPACIDF
jgi:hypothetical protein